MVALEDDRDAWQSRDDVHKQREDRVRDVRAVRVDDQRPGTAAWTGHERFVEPLVPRHVKLHHARERRRVQPRPRVEPEVRRVHVQVVHVEQHASPRLRRRGR